jgi:ADP-ribose pyrophosphatase YjhB (NUDIX family)
MIHCVDSTLDALMKFCSNCGHAVTLRIPEGDTRPRHVCDNCHTIHYVNPRNVVGTVPVWQDKVLLCRRAIEPRYGYWTLPAGFMEIGETTAEAGARETLEEAGARVTVGELFSIMNVPHVHQVHLFYLAHLNDLDIAAGEESLEVRLFDEEEIPWSQLAFPTVIHTLRFFFEDRDAGRVRDGNFRLHTMDIEKPLQPLGPDGHSLS